MSKKIHPARMYQGNKERSSADIFNELNIQYRICYQFQPKKGDTEGLLCVCNRQRDEHDSKDPIKDAQWNMRHNTIEKEHPEHGRLPNSGAWFLRLALDTPVEKVERVLLDVWKIPKPRLIMSIIGGAKYFVLDDRLETNFINGIIDVALTSDAWLFTTGYNVGIVQVVGQAINKFNLIHPNKHITAIGICKWGSIKNVRTITKSSNTEEQRTTDQLNTSADSRKQTEREHGERDLEMNHSHYLMLDDGTIRYYDTGNYRTRLAIQIGKLQHENDFPLPAVTIVVEGGKDTIANIYYDLRENIPIVIIGGSGRVADFYKRWLLYTKEFDNITKEENWDTIYDIDELQEIRSLDSSELANSNNQSLPRMTAHTQIELDKSLERLKIIFQKYEHQLEDDLKNTLLLNENSEKNLKNLAKQVMYCLQPAVRSSMIVFNLNADGNLSETIFRSICQSRQKYPEKKFLERKSLVEISRRYLKPPMTSLMKKHQSQSHFTIQKHDESAIRSQLLELAMNWNCIDVAKELILKNSLNPIPNMKQVFIRALTNNLPTFVYEYIKLGVDLSEIFYSHDCSFDKDRYKNLIKELYTIEAVNSEKTHLKYFIPTDRGVQQRNVNSVGTLNTILQALIGDYIYKLYFNNQTDENNYRLKHGLISEIRVNDEDHTIQQNHMNNKKKQLINDYVMRDLFFWAILMNYIDMAKVCLSHMKYRICPALLATKILKQYHHKASYGELRDDYEKSAKYFEQYAIDCLDKSDDHDAAKACEIILQRNELYGYVTCLQVAADAKDKLFLATPCCVEAMNNVWYDQILPEKSAMNDVTILIGIATLGLLAPAIVNFRTSGKEVRDEPFERTLQPYGINYSDPYVLEHPNRINNYLPRLIHFHRALCVKFYYHFINYAFFLLLFSFVLLFEFQLPGNRVPSIHWTEILTIILVICMFIEEIRYLCSLDSITWSGKFRSYFRDSFKPMTLISFVLFYAGLILRFTYARTEDQFMVARIIMAIDLEVWWLRSLAFIIIGPFLGPHLVAIGKMLKDLGFFMCIIAIVMLGYGISSRSMVYYPNADKFNTSTAFDGRSVFRQIAYPVYYLMYGEIQEELANLDTYPNAAWSLTTHVLLAIHMLFVNILLINLLIAIFSKRYDEVFEDTKNIWHSQQYVFTREYYTRSPFFPPISLLYDIYYLCRMIIYFIPWLCWNKAHDSHAKVFKMIPIHEILIKEWYEFEGASTYAYAHNEVKALTKSIVESDLYNLVKREEAIDNKTRTNNVRNTHKAIQDDLIRLDTSIERMKEELKKSIDDIKGEFQQSIGAIKTAMEKLLEEKKKST